MQTQYIIHSNTLTKEQKILIETTLQATPKANKNHFRVTCTRQESTTISHLSQQLELDINAIPENFQPESIKLLISDMDSTLIGIECIDEIADMLNIKPQISEITEAAMRGELDFTASLKQRVQLLKGLETSALETVYQERLFLNPGAEQWVAGLHQKGIKFALVSGGFTYFTERLHQQLNLDFSRANVLSMADNKLTGTVKGRIIDGQAKADFLHELCQQHAITPNQVIAIGDGANDLLMMEAAGLSIAYRAKPSVQAQAMVALNYSPLTAVLDLLD